MKRTRLLLSAFVVAALSLIAAACGGGGGGDSGPIKVGVLQPLTGFGAVLGEEAVRGIEFYLEEELGGEIAGRQIELVVEDDAGEANQGVTRLRQMLERDQIDVLIGPLFSDVGLAVREMVISAGIPQIYAIPGNLQESGEPERAENIFRVSFVNQGLGAVVAGPIQQLGFDRVALMAMDYVSGREISREFEEAFTAGGGEVTEKVFTPVGTPDFSPFLSQIQSEDIDAVYAFYVGGDAVRLFTHAQEMGLTPDLTFVGLSLMDDLNLRELGDKALNVIALQSYASTLDTPANEEFAAAFTEKFGFAPTTYAVDGYKAIKAVGEALGEIDGDAEDREAFVEALQDVEFETPEGTFSFDERGIGVLPLYAFQVQEAGDSFELRVIEEFGMIDSSGPVEDAG